MDFIGHLAATHNERASMSERMSVASNAMPTWTRLIKRRQSAKSMGTSGGDPAN
jgi:hypothetical protein